MSCCRKTAESMAKVRCAGAAHIQGAAPMPDFAQETRRMAWAEFVGGRSSQDVPRNSKGHRWRAHRAGWGAMMAGLVKFESEVSYCPGIGLRFHLSTSPSSNTQCSCLYLPYVRLRLHIWPSPRPPQELTQMLGPTLLLAQHTMLLRVPTWTRASTRTPGQPCVPHRSSPRCWASPSSPPWASLRACRTG